jgi:DHA2 family multidrug resistance protein
MTQVLHQQGFSLADAAVRAQAMLYGLVQQQAGILAFMDCFWVLTLVFVGLIPFMLLMRGTGRR